MEPIVNRVAKSPIETLDLASLWDGREIVEIDIAEFLDRGFILREKQFRVDVRAHDWSKASDAHVGLVCSTDAIVPTWAYMFLGSILRETAYSVTVGNSDDVRNHYFLVKLNELDWSAYADKPIVVKGCANTIVPENAYALATEKLEQVAKKVMYGEPCSTVPIWRRK